jgi:hypothetical protein
MGAGHGEKPLVRIEETAVVTERVSAHAAVRAPSAIRRGSPELPLQRVQSAQSPGGAGG